MRPCFASLIVVAVSLHASAVSTTNSNGSVMTPNSELTRNQLVATDVSGLLSSESDPNVVFTNGELLVRGERVKTGPDETEVQEIANTAVETNALTVATTNRVAAHVKNTDNPHDVTAEQIGALPLVEDENGEKTAVTIGSRIYGEKIGEHSIENGLDVSASGPYSHAEGIGTTASGGYSHAEGAYTTASVVYSHAEGNGAIASGEYSHAEGTYTTASGTGSHTSGVNSQTLEGHKYAFAWNGDDLISQYTSHGPGTYNINPAGGLDGFFIGEQTLPQVINAAITGKADKADISSTNTTFSNAVLAVGLNIDTNSVAVINDIAATFGGFPIEGTATTVGGLLAALAAAVAWMKKNKVQTLKLNDNSVETSAENGIAKLDDFFTESNSLLNGRLAYSRNATGLKDRAFNTLTFDGTEYNLSTALAAVTPTASGQPRDLLIVATATAATTISFTAGTIKGDKPTIDGSGTWLITLTEYASGVWYCRQIKMEDAA